MRTAKDRELYSELRRLKNEHVTMQRETSQIRASLEAQKQELLQANAELEATNRRLAALATQDDLTGLSNHRAFQERLTAEVRRADRYQAPLVLIMIDVDHFKQYNDTYGHPAGDTVLKRIAVLLQSGIRDTDMAARYGGEEFALILPEMDRGSALTVAERVRAAVASAPWEKRAVTVSLGVCSLSQAADPSALIVCADDALYRSKKNGKNRVTYGCPGDRHAPAAPEAPAQ
jgi:diguanylate cyclase (GGDEF)-like protein